MLPFFEKSWYVQVDSGAHNVAQRDKDVMNDWSLSIVFLASITRRAPFVLVACINEPIGRDWKSLSSQHNKEPMSRARRARLLDFRQVLSKSIYFSFLLLLLLWVTLRVVWRTFNCSCHIKGGSIRDTMLLLRKRIWSSARRVVDGQGHHSLACEASTRGYSLLIYGGAIFY